MIFQNTTAIPTAVVRGALSWCLGQRGMPPELLNHAKFRVRSGTQYGGYATDRGKIVVSIGPPDLFPAVVTYRGKAAKDPITGEWGLFADPLEALIALITHELVHIEQFASNTYGRGAEKAACAAEWPALHAFREQRNVLVEKWLATVEHDSDGTPTACLQAPAASSISAEPAPSESVQVPPSVTADAVAGDPVTLGPDGGRYRLVYSGQFTWGIERWNVDAWERLVTGDWWDLRERVRQLRDDGCRNAFRALRVSQSADERRFLRSTWPQLTLVRRRSKVVDSGSMGNGFSQTVHTELWVQLAGKTVHLFVKEYSRMIGRFEIWQELSPIWSGDMDDSNLPATLAKEGFNAAQVLWRLNVQ